MSLIFFLSTKNISYLTLKKLLSVSYERFYLRDCLTSENWFLFSKIWLNVWENLIITGLSYNVIKWISCIRWWCEYIIDSHWQRHFWDHPESKWFWSVDSDVKSDNGINNLLLDLSTSEMWKIIKNKHRYLVVHSNEEMNKTIGDLEQFVDKMG